jgi:hypothetical protein
MTNLGWIRPHPVEAQQHDQRGEAWISRSGYFRMCRHSALTFIKICRY